MGKMATPEDLLRTCPPEKRVHYQKAAVNALKGQRAKAIHLKCLDCVAWNPGEVARCHLEDCPLWIFRGSGEGLHKKQATHVGGFTDR